MATGERFFTQVTFPTHIMPFSTDTASVESPRHSRGHRTLKTNSRITESSPKRRRENSWQISSVSKDLYQPFAQEYSERGAKKRRELVSDRDPSTPKYIYQLYTSIQEDERHPPIVQFRRSYAQHELASEDALSWLLEQHRMWGSDRYLEDVEYGKEWEGKCAKFSTSPTDIVKWHRSYSAWTVEDLLY
jgi:hypothetical protein